ncbi:MAG: HEAT repeat domain-containing protein [Planctomycetota bacterium]
MSAQGPELRNEWQAFFGSEFGDLSKGSKKARVEAAWKTLLIGGNRQRREARSELVGLGSTAVGRLLRELDSESREASRQAILTLGRLGAGPEDRVVQAIEGAFKRGSVQSDEVMLRRLGWALGRMGHGRHAASMFSALQEAQRRETRRHLLYALARVGKPAQAERLGRFWDRWKNQESRAALLLALGRLGDPGGDRTIRVGLRSRKDSIRQAAAFAAADRRAAFNFKQCLRLLGDRKDVVREATLIGLALIEDPQIVRLLLDRRFLQHRDGRIRALSALALARQGGDEALLAIIQRLKPKKERDDKVRRVLYLALGRFRDVEAQAPLVAGLTASSSRSARAALLGLLMRGRGGVDLRKLVDGKNSHLGALALRILVWRRPEKGLALAEGLVDSAKGSPALRDIAREILRVNEDGMLALRTWLRAGLQLEVDNLGGSPEWELLQGLHRQMLRIEGLDRPLDGRSGVRTTPSGQARPIQRMSKEEEDLRLWLDRHPYFDRRRGLEIVNS